VSRLLALVLLVAVYAMTLASFAPWDLLAGALVSAAVLVATRRLSFGDGSTDPPPLGRRLLHFPRFAVELAREVAVGTWQVSLVVLGVRPLRRPGIVAVPVGERTASGVAASALAMTLSPGEVFVDVDWERRVMLVHVLDASDPDGVRRRYDAFYRRFQREVFP
jgi:multisubunit Na+/H+ antiporter MnhE subunit